jgi:hypothetical protein
MSVSGLGRMALVYGGAALGSAAIGAGVIALTSDGGSAAVSDPPAPRCADIPGGPERGTCVSSGFVVTFAAPGDAATVEGVRVRIMDVRTVAPVTPEGQRKGRLRLVVTLRAQNRARRVAFGVPPSYVYFAGSGLRRAADRNAMRREGAFDVGRPLPPGATRTGTLSFETAGAATRRLRRARRPSLRVRPFRVARDGLPRVAVLRFGAAVLRG